MAAKRAITGGAVGKRAEAARRRPPSTVYFVGAGPGDEDLITVKGCKLLKRADVVVYAGSLVNPALLARCKKGARVYDSASMTHGEIARILIDGARAGKKVVRLHTGDPSLYSAVGEQAASLDGAGVAYEMVPGVSSAFASAAAIKRELTVPEAVQTVIFTRLGGRTKVAPEQGLARLAAHGATLCIFLSASMIGRVAAELVRGGCGPSTPVAVVYKASWSDEKVVTGTIGDIAAKVKKAGIKRHAMIIAGRAVGGEAGARSRLYDSVFSHGFRRGRKA